MSNERSSKPFKKIDCTRRGFLRMPGNALKIWLYYYTREGKERLAWASEEELCAATDLNRDTMRKWRNWLVDYGWLKLMGHRDPNSGEFSVPIYRVKEGTVAETFSDGRSKNKPPKYSTTVQPKLSVTVPAETFGEEVEPVKQVDSKEEVEPFEVEPVNNNNQPVVVVSQSSNSKSEPRLVAGYSQEQIAKHADACRMNPWVREHDSPKARLREGFVTHLMTIDPPRKLRMVDGKPLPQYRQDSGKSVLMDTCSACGFGGKGSEPGEDGLCAACRIKRAVEDVTATAKPGTHAALNPELHTGLDGQGRPTLGWRCSGKNCMFYTRNADKVCDACKGIVPDPCTICGWYDAKQQHFCKPKAKATRL